MCIRDSAKSALNAKESQEKVDKATDALNAAIKALVKNGNQDVYKRQEYYQRNAGRN